MRRNGRVIVAGLVCLSPFAMTALMSLESFLIFCGIMAAFVVCFVGFCILHWAIETVLVALGFNRDAINKDDSKTTFIFWGGN